MAMEQNRPWYYSTWLLILTFIFITPVWSILVIMSPYAVQWLKIAGWVFLALYIVSCILFCVLGGVAGLTGGGGGNA